MAVRVRETWSSFEAAWITRVPYRSLHNWVQQVEPFRSDLNQRRVPGLGGKMALRWTFQDLLIARLFKDLREHGVSMQKIRRAACYLVEQGLDVHHLEPLGNDLILWVGEQTALSALLTPGQLKHGYLIWDPVKVEKELTQTIEELMLAA